MNDQDNGPEDTAPAPGTSSGAPGAPANDFRAASLRTVTRH